MRLLFTTIFLLTLVFAACIGLIRAQPYDDGDLRAFLTPPEGCPMPCFMGIRPGVTTAEEAIAILEAHEWVDTVSRYEITEGRGVASLTASWSGAQPEMINDTFELWLSIRENMVQMISIPTRIPLGSILLQIGTPEYGEVSANPIPETSTPSSGYYALYREPDMVFASSTYCPIPSVWHLSVEWVLWYDGALEQTPESYDLPFQVRPLCRKLLNSG